ncbi:hypothetical protein CBR_g18736 [Chara braunii]|uniref:Uncharacterized protein n=1 Tax=Chara braunii TaxID=69332 RepID=A0A388KW79_CHABU|nr:hypothetical protein CBR_g18736 [Chara braunii]|eukprot:GBG74325.1 hypothetical protein CBR_g18736 [Chara braunii]
MVPRGQQKAKRPHGVSGEASAGQTGRGHIPKSKKLRAGYGSEGEMGGDGGEEETPMDITSKGTPVLGFERDGMSRQRMLALTNLGVPTSTRGGGGGTARAQGVSSGDIPPQRVVGLHPPSHPCSSATKKLRAGAYIENRLEDDAMAAHQEATVMHIASCFHDALRAGQWWDGGRLSHQRLSRIGDAFRLLLAACMWIMRMGGDDARSYGEASYYAQLVAKPTLVAACSSSFNWRRYVMHSANVVLTRLQKPPLTLGAFPDYIPEWASCGVRYNCNAGLADPNVAARVDWMGTGPFEADRKEDGTDDETGA